MITKYFLGGKFYLVAIFCLIFCLQILQKIEIIRAADELTIKYPVDSLTQKKLFFDEENILPGWEKTVIFRVENEDKEREADFFVTFEVIEEEGNKDFAKMLKVSIVQVSDGEYEKGGPEERKNLSEIDGKKILIGTISPQKGKNYKIKIAFDKNAGNQYQGEKVKFKLNFQLEGKVTEEDNLGIISQSLINRVIGQEIRPIEENEEGLTKERELESTNGKKLSSEEIIAGSKVTCKGLSILFFILGLIFYSVVFWWDKSDKFKKNKRGWGFSIFLTIAALFLWQIFDYCKQYRWIGWAILVIALFWIIYFYQKERKKDLIWGRLDQNEME